MSALPQDTLNDDPPTILDETLLQDEDRETQAATHPHAERHPTRKAQAVRTGSGTGSKRGFAFLCLALALVLVGAFFVRQAFKSPNGLPKVSGLEKPQARTEVAAEPLPIAELESPAPAAATVAAVEEPATAASAVVPGPGAAVAAVDPVPAVDPATAAVPAAQPTETAVVAQTPSAATAVAPSAQGVAEATTQIAQVGINAGFAAAITQLQADVAQLKTLQAQRATRAPSALPRSASSGVVRSAAAKAPSAPQPAAPQATGTVLAVDLWDGKPSVVVGTGIPQDRRVLFLAEGDRKGRVTLKQASVARQEAVFDVQGQEARLASDSGSRP